MTNEQMIRELRAVAEKHRGKQTYTFETNINLMATDAANRIESLCDEISRQKAEVERLENSLAISKKETKRYVEKYKRQKAEIERLQDYNENLRCINTDLSNNLLYEVETAKAEAVKEFAFMLKAMAAGRLAWDEYDEEICGFLAVDEIDNLVKEFTEGGDTQ